MRDVAIMTCLLLALLLAGCSAMEVRKGASLNETRELFSSAKYTGAAVKSPYEFYSAEIYLDQAETEYQKGNNSVADAYLQKANDFASLAYKNAKKFRKIKLK